MNGEGHSDDQSAALREAFLQRLEQIAKNTVLTSEEFQRTASALSRRLEANTKALRGFAVQLQELNAHIQGFEQFMSGLTSTYEEGEEEEMRDDILDLVDNIGRIADAFGGFSRGGRRKRP